MKISYLTPFSLTLKPPEILYKNNEPSLNKISFSAKPDSAENSKKANSVSLPFLSSKFNINFEGKLKGAKAEDNKRPDYSDMENFPVYLEEKIKRMASLGIKTETKSAIKSSADIEAINEQFKKDNIGFIYSSGVSLNNVLNYLSNKGQISLSKKRYDRGAFMADDFSIGYIEEMAKKNDYWFHNIISYAQRGIITFYTFDTKENSQKLNKRLNKALGKEVKVKRINPPENSCFKHPSADVIRETVKAISEYKFPDDKEKREKFIQMAFKYLDDFLFVLSYEKIIQAAKKQYEMISGFAKSRGKTPDDVIYLIPYENKSYELINYIYASTNNTGADKFRLLQGDMQIDPDKIYVVLDDVSLSGESTETTITRFEGVVSRNNFTKENTKNGVDFIFSPVLSTEHAIDLFQTLKKTPEIKSGANVHYFPVLKCRELAYDTKLDEEESEYLKNNLISGFGKMYSCIALPYMIPDNSSDVGGIIGGNFLNINDSKGDAADYNHTYGGKKEPEGSEYSKISKFVKEKCQKYKTGL